jgi:hypothetical protein
MSPYLLSILSHKFPNDMQFGNVVRKFYLFQLDNVNMDSNEIEQKFISEIFQDL